MTRFALAPSKNEYSKFKSGYTRYLMVVQGKPLFECEVNDRIDLYEPYYLLDDNEVLYRYDYKGSNYDWEQLRYSGDIEVVEDYWNRENPMLDEFIRMQLEVVSVFYVAYRDFDEELASMLHLKSLLKLKKMYIKKLPRHLRKLYGPKFNPKVKFIEVSA